MRTIAIEGATAAYKRLRNLDEIAEYGLDLPEQDTAPFRVSWDIFKNAPGVFLNRTRVAHLDFSRSTPRLMIVKAYPEVYDHVLIRALRNAVAVTDQMHKMKKSESGPKNSLLTTTFEDFEITLSVDRLHQAILGAERVDPRFQLLAPLKKHAWKTTPTLKITLDFGTTTTDVFLVQDKGVIKTENNYGTSRHLRKDKVLSLLEQGLEFWDAHFSAEALHTALLSPPDLSACNIWQIEDEYKARITPKPTNMKDSALSFGPFVFCADERNKHMFFDGFRIMTVSYDDVKIDITKIVDMPDPALLETMMKALTLAWKAKILGGELADFPRITTENMTNLIENTDFGYGL